MSNLIKVQLNNIPLDLKHTLTCGQAFRWKEINNKWVGFINNQPISLYIENDNLISESINFIPEKNIHEYFELDIDINHIYSHLIDCDKDIEPLINKYYGLRILRQDTEETLYSFLCSAANSIPKISMGIGKLCALFPQNKIGEYYTFPSTCDIINSNIEDLASIKELAFRSRNIYECANIIKNKCFFEELKTMNYENAHKTLTGIKNIGYKIADCICLFSLDFPEVVPVDTHVRQIAENKFNYKINSKTISKKVYREIQQIFLDKYGKYAGWAQQFLFMNEI